MGGTTICPRSSDPFLYSKLLNKMGHYFMDTQQDKLCMYEGCGQDLPNFMNTN